jgi:hypothetical protein
MLIVYQEELPEAYLLVLAAGGAVRPEAELAYHLGRAVQSGRLAVWIDCRLLDTLSPLAGRLLRRLHHCLRQRQAQLVLCRVSEGLASCLQAAGAVPGPGLVLADSLDEAAACAPAR